MAFFRRKIEPARPVLRAVQPSPRATEPLPDRPAAVEPPAAAEPAPSDLATGDELRILVICTANVCRSPLAASLVGLALGRHGIAAHVSSAGIAAARLPVDPRSAEYAARAGGDLWTHQPRQLEPELLRADGRDLVITMGREHLREAAVMNPAHLRRMFTLKELARRAARHPATAGESVGSWIDRLALDRRPADLLGEQQADEIPDPYGRSDAMFRDVAGEIDGLVNAVVGQIARCARPNPTRRGG